MISFGAQAEILTTCWSTTRVYTSSSRSTGAGPAERGRVACGRLGEMMPQPRLSGQPLSVRPRSPPDHGRGRARPTPRPATAVQSPPTAAATTGGCRRLRFHRDQSERLAVREGTTVTSAARYQSGQLGLRAGGSNRTTSAMPRVAASFCSSSGRSPARAARAPHHGHDQLRTQRRIVLDHVGGGAEQHVRCLERLDPADEEASRRRFWATPAGPVRPWCSARDPASRAEEREAHAGVDRGHPGRIGAP